MPHSVSTVLPTKTAPAARRRATTVESRSTRAGGPHFEPSVVAKPATSNSSFTRKGTPSSAPRAIPPAMRAVAASASASVIAASDATRTFIEGLRVASSASAAIARSATARGVTRRSRYAAANADAARGHAGAGAAAGAGGRSTGALAESGLASMGMSPRIASGRPGNASMPRPRFMISRMRASLAGVSAATRAARSAGPRMRGGFMKIPWRRGAHAARFRGSARRRSSASEPIRNGRVCDRRHEQNC
jgi:hypothetical protein